MTGGFAKPHVARHLSGKNVAAEVCAHLGGDLLAQPRAPIEHGDDDAQQPQVGVDPLAHEVDGAEQLGEPLEGKVLGLHRHERLVGGGQPVHGQHTERRRTVDEHELVGVKRALQRAAQYELAILGAGELDFGAGQIAARRHHPERLHGGRLRDLGERHLAAEHAIDRPLGRLGLEAEPTPRVALRVEIDEQRGEAGLGQAGGHVDRRRGLAYPALLVGDGDDARHRAARRPKRTQGAQDPGRATTISVAILSTASRRRQTTARRRTDRPATGAGDDRRAATGATSGQRPLGRHARPPRKVRRRGRDLFEHDADRAGQR